VVAKKTTPAKADATEPKAAPKKREPKPVTDLASAMTALRAAQRRSDRADKAYDAARDERKKASDALIEAKAAVKKYYAEAMGEDQADEAPAIPGALTGEALPDDEPPYEGDGYGDTAHTA